MKQGGESGRLLITGAAGGMGSVCARLAAERGWRLLLCDLPGERLAALAGECGRLGAEVATLPLDVTAADQVAAVARAAADGGIAALVHTVGISPTMADWRRILEVDLIGTVRFLEALRPALAEGGAAVAISSMSAYLAPPFPDLERLLADPLAEGLLERLADPAHAALHDPGMAYSLAKRALRDYVRAQARRWGREGKRLNSISPGLIDTAQSRLEVETHRDTFRQLLAAAALHRMGRPEEIATAALFLVSPDASYIAGIDLLVDGGVVAGIASAPSQGSVR
ncbi:MAG: short-chain dehydrogenase/reductas [Porticoccaceae bacterium]|nr:MAG: short-chain dehydrogenase/reductas [Porticoccaceae bacterium]